MDTFSQNVKCKCNTAENNLNEIRLLFEKKDYQKIPILLDNIDQSDIACKQEVLLYKLDLYVALNKKAIADSIQNVIRNNIPGESCNALRMKYHFSLGNYFFKTELRDSAMHNFLLAKDMAEKANDTLMQLKAIYRIANIFNKLNQPLKAIEYDRKEVFLAKKTNNPKLIMTAYSNLQAHFGALYDKTQDRTYLDSIFSIAYPALELGKKTNQLYELAQTYSVLAGTVLLKNNYQTALKYCDSGLMYSDRTKEFRLLHSIFTKKCDTYMELKDFRSSKQYADSALYYAGLEHNPLSIATVYERLYEIDKLQNNYSSALFYFESFTNIRDSILSIEKTELINELEQKYNKAQNEKVIGELKQGKQIASLKIKVLSAGVLSAFLVIFIIVIFYRQSIYKKKQENLEIELRLNRARMNPHFFFNTLNSLQTFSILENKESKVANYLSLYAKLMRQTLESTYNEMITIEDEMTYLENYLEIQKLRYPDLFEYTFHLDNNIEPSDIFIPGMIIQPFIENSIEHAFKNNAEPGRININMLTDNHLLVIEIIDNGIGYKKDTQVKEYPSRAMQIINDTLSILNKKYKIKSSFDIRKGHDNKGTYIKILLPLLYTNDSAVN